MYYAWRTFGSLADKSLRNLTEFEPVAYVITVNDPCNFPTKQKYSKIMHDHRQKFGSLLLHVHSPTTIVPKSTDCTAHTQTVYYVTTEICFISINSFDCNVTSILSLAQFFSSLQSHGLDALVRSEWLAYLASVAPPSRTDTEEWLRPPSTRFTITTLTLYAFAPLLCSLLRFHWPSAVNA